MRKNDKKKHSDQDEKAESRIELKNKLDRLDIGDDFIISRFSDTLSENQRAINMFPQINEPTLQFKETEQSHHLKLQDDMSLDRYEPEGLTARLSYQERSGNQVFLLEERVEALAKEVEDKNAEILVMKKRSEAAQKELDRVRKELARKNETVESLQKELMSLKLKQSTSDYESRNCSNSKSLMEESINNFCPELLSPDETVQLLNQLLRKVSKSSKMMKSLTNDAATKDILNKINKN